MQDDKKHGVPISIHGLEKNFGKVEVLKGIDLEIKAGEFIALVGKSGCGKSTLLRMISHLEHFDRGTVQIGDTIDQEITPQVRYLFQEARLLPWRTVSDNVKLGARGQSDEAANKALSEVELLDKKAFWPEVLSGGQRQRVALARALVGKPKALLLDEPLGALDALTRLKMQQLIERLWKEQGFTAILVTHDVSEAVYLANRVVLLENGKITMDEEIRLARPRGRDSSFAYFEKRILERILHESLSQNEGVLNQYAI